MAYAALLRTYTSLCGFILLATGVLTVVFAPKHVLGGQDKHLECGSNSFEEVVAVFSIAGLEILSGVLVLSAEFRLSCLSRYAGFLVTLSGKGAFLIFTGCLVATIGKGCFNSTDAGKLVPFVFGFMMVGGGVVQCLSALPCFNFPIDGLRQRFLAGEVSEGGKKQGSGKLSAHKKEALSIFSGGSKGAKAGSEVTAAERGGTEMDNGGNEPVDASAVVVGAPSPSKPNPFYGNKHLSSN